MHSNVLRARLQAPFGERTVRAKAPQEGGRWWRDKCVWALCGSPREVFSRECIPPDEVHPAVAMGKHLGLFFNCRVSVFTVVSGIPACSAFSHDAHRGQPWHLSVNLIIRRRNGSGSSHDGLGVQVCRDGYHLRDCFRHIVHGWHARADACVSPDQVREHQGLAVITGIVIALIGTAVVSGQRASVMQGKRMLACPFPHSRQVTLLGV